MMGGGMMDGMTALVWIWVVVPLLVLVVVSVWLVRTVRSRAGSDAAAARRGLDLRYARGEVDRDEYLQRRADLEESRR